MPYKHADMFEQIVSHIEPLQKEIHELINELSLTLQADSPAIEWQMFPAKQATAEYILWAEAGLIVLRAKLPCDGRRSDAIHTYPVTMRFSLSHELGEEVEEKKRRIEEILEPEAELFWGVQPIGHLDHVDLTLSFAYQPQSSLLRAYCACVLGMLTGKVMAA